MENDCYCDAWNPKNSSAATVHFSLEQTPSVSGFFIPFFPTQEDSTSKKGKKMAEKTGKYVVTIKDGDSYSEWSEKTNSYKFKTKDQVEEFDDLANAMAEFLYYVTDTYENKKVTMTYVPPKNKK